MEPERIKSMLEAGRVEEVSDWLRKEGARAARDAPYFKTIGLHFEEAGLVAEALLCWNMALRAEPSDADLLRKIAEIHQDGGDLKKAVNYRRKVLDLGKGNADDWAALGELLEESGDHEAAAATYRKGYEETGEARLQALAKSLTFRDAGVSGETISSSDETKEDEEVPVPTESQLVTFLELFSGREGVYARQWVNPKGESGYTPVYEPLTYHVARNHIIGNYTVGVYPLRVDHTVKFVALDIDIAKFHLNQAVTNRRLWDRAMEEAKKVAQAFAFLASKHGMPLYIESSGFKGYHCWIFLSRPMPARIARRAALLLISKCQPLPNIVQVEGFPRQSFLTGKGLGNLIKLPLGIHRRTGRRSVFMEPDGTPVAHQLKFLEKIEKTSVSAIQSMILRCRSGRVVEISRPEAAPSSLPERVDEFDDIESAAAQALPRRAEPYNPEGDVQYQYLLSRCAVLRSLVEKVHQEAEITNDDRIVMTYTFGLLEHGVEIVNSLLQRCVNVEPGSYLKSRLGGNPISCPKIRSRIPGVTSRLDCNCQFDSRVHMYPNPLIHIKEMDSLKQATWTGKTADSLQFQQLMQEYLKARKQIRELDVLMKAYEDRLDAFFDQAGVEQVETPLGILRRSKDREGKGKYSLDL